MPNHKLSLDEVEQNYYFVAIHSILEAYNLAFILNKELGLSFFRHEFNVSFSNTNEFYMAYKNNEDKNNPLIYFFSNSFNDSKSEASASSLFRFNGYKKALVPELSKADYIMKYFGRKNDLPGFIKSVSLLNGVSSCYEHSSFKLRLKENLIFD